MLNRVIKSSPVHCYWGKLIRTGKDEHISAMATPTNHVKNVTTTHPHIKLAGPAYRRVVP